MKKTDLDLDEIIKLARNGASNSEIAAFYDCRLSTVTNRAEKQLRIGRELLNMDIRKAQISLAKDGNSAMLTFLGKELLNQTGKANEDGGAPDTSKVGDMSTSKLTKLLDAKK